uniref:Uncharacterized protein n=2 Tax=Kalanchoe fedtschenkoi TaxID=63787 RepID=A0A7N1A1E3_KALFE
MDELGAVWLRPQSSEDELKHKILLTTFELETLKMEVNMIRQQSEATEKQMHDQLELAYKERDEAKLQLEALLESFMLPSSAPRTMKEIDNTSPVIPVKPHSAVTDQSNDVDSFFDTVSSASKSMEESQNRHAPDDELNSSLLSPSCTMLGTGQPGQPMTDRASAVIEQLVNGKMLPQKGRLLEAVMKAGPTLQAMLVAGPLPQWKNPPPAQPFRFSPILASNNVMMMINGAPNNHRAVLMHPGFNTNSMHSQSKHHSPFRGSMRMDVMDGAMVDGSSCCLNNNEGGMMMNNAGKTNSLITVGKRRRLM